jgi:hypothetical protein
MDSPPDTLLGCLGLYSPPMELSPSLEAALLTGHQTEKETEKVSYIVLISTLTS